jgi:hypothetical protein
MSKKDEIGVPPGQLSLVEENGKWYVRRLYKGKVIPIRWKEYIDDQPAINGTEICGDEADDLDMHR